MPQTNGSCPVGVQQANSRSFSKTKRQYHECHEPCVFTACLFLHLIPNAAISKAWGHSVPKGPHHTV